MQANQYEYLKFVRFRELDNWSARYMIDRQVLFNHKFQLNKLSSFLNKGGTITTIDDNGEYKRITVKTKNGGVCLRDIVTGKNIGTKKQWLVSEGLFIISKIDARNGALGIIPKELNDAIVTNDFPVFNIDKGSIVPQYLLLVTTTERFVEFVQKCSSGTTNRQRVDVNDFLDVKIPLPTLSEQQALVEAYNSKIKAAEEKERRAVQLNNEIEDYLLSELGIKLKGTYSQNLLESSVCAEPQVEYCINPASSAMMKDTYHWGDEIKKEYRWLKFVRFKDVDRWDCYNAENDVFSIVKHSIYPIFEIGKAFDFISRGWKKEEKTFRYVELGSVDTLNGIMSAEQIETSKAPSRATQKIKAGDLIIGTTRPYLKKFAIVNAKYDDCVCSSGFQVVLPSQKYNLHFLYEYLLSQVAVSQFEFYMTGALYPAITNADLRKILIPLPPLEIQNSIVSHINVLKEQMKQLKQEAKELRENALVEFEKEIFEN